MSIIDTTLFIIFALLLFLSIFIYSRNRKSVTNISFSILSLVGAFWAFTIVMFRISDALESALLWDRLIYICGILAPLPFLFFAQAFPEKKIKVPLSHIIAFVLSVAVFIPALLSSRLWIQKVILTPDGNSVILGPFYTVWVVWFIVYMGWATLILFSKYRRVQGIEKIQFRYIF